MERSNHTFPFLLFINFFWKVLVSLGTICFIFVFLPSGIIEHWMLYVVILFSLTLLISLLLTRNFIKKETSNILYSSCIPNQLLDIVSQLSTEESVILVGAIDRYLHLNGCYKERIQLGELLIDNGNIEIQVGNQIDRFGWANYKLGNVEPAISSITEGIELAKENCLFYMAAKGERHLAGIQKGRKNVDEYQRHVNLSKGYTEQIQNTDERNEMRGSLHLLEAKYLLDQGNLSQAKIEADEAMRLFSNDPIRQLKVYYVLGQIHFKREEWDEAYKMHYEGYIKSKGVRDEERVRNAYELARIHTKAEKYLDKNKAEEYQAEAILLTKKTVKQHIGRQ